MGIAKAKASIYKGFDTNIQAGFEMESLFWMEAMQSDDAKAAKICREPVEACANDEVWGRVVDGGYHENSGAQTAAGVLRAFRRAAWRFQRAHPQLARIEPYVILVSNDPASGRLRLEQINEGFDLLHEGRAVRQVVAF